MTKNTTIKKIINVSALLILCASLVKGQSAIVSINIDLSKTYQRIDNFGASDAWACQFVGKWTKEKKDRIADLLFSKDTLADGSPAGIALSLWRFNIGAGSAEQGDKNNIKDEWRRAESFLNDDNTYNWQKQAGQVWFLEAAKKRGVNQFLGFVNSPPVKLTLNAKAYADSGKANIAANQYKAFANYLATVTKGVYKISGVKFNYISPVNEPQWDWSDNKQEGCPYNNREIAGLVRSVDSSFTRNDVKAKIVIAEAGEINYLFSAGDKSGKGNQVNDFFGAESPDYVGNLKHVDNLVLGHSYFTTSPVSVAIKSRAELAQSIGAVSGLKFWQSEYCILGNNAGEIDGNKRDLGMDAALYMARVIHTDLTAANAAAWSWWTAISPFDYKDGLIYIDKSKTDGNYYPSKMLWALGNYSRFVRPGAVRIAAGISSSSYSTEPLLVSAFKDGKKLIIVIVNNNQGIVPVKSNIGKSKIKRARMFTTSSSANLKAGGYINVKNSIPIQPRSITTITGIIQ
ncbi:MAG: glycoside hydrolase [Mucilaginibacter sp.]